MNGVDPSPQDITLENGFFTKHQVKVLLLQPAGHRLPDRLRSAQTASRRASRSWASTRPCRRPGYDYQSWMLAEVTAIRRRSPTGPPPSTCEGCTATRFSEADATAEVAEIGPSADGGSSTGSPFAHVGQFTGLIGSNGAGKTTLLRVILGLITPGPARSGCRGQLGPDVTRRSATSRRRSSWSPTCRCGRGT